MADAKDDKKVEVPKGAKEAAPEVAPETVKKQRKRAEIALETREAVSRDDTRTLISSIDLEKPLDEQVEALASLGYVLEEVIYKALQNGEKMEEIKKSPLSIKRYAQSGEQIIALKMLEQLIANENVASEYLIKYWRDLCNESGKDYKAASKEKDRIESGDEEEPEETSWIPTAARIGLIAAGAYGAHMLWKWFKNRKKKDQPKRNLYIGGALTLVGVGALIGPENLGDWSQEYMNLSFSKESLEDFWAKIKEGEIKEAFASFKMETQDPGILRAAKELDIDKGLLIDLKDFKYGDFLSFKSDAQRSGKSFLAGAAEFLGVDISKKIIGTNIDNELRNARQEEKLLDFIKKNDNLLKDKNIKKMTIGEILNELYEKGALGEFEGKEGEETEKEPASELEAKQGTLEDYAAVFPNAKAAVERFQEGETGLAEGASEVIEGTLKDGGAVVVKDGGLWLVKGPALVFLSASSIVLGTFTDIAELFSREKGVVEGVSDIVINYFERGGGWWIAGGSLIGGTLGIIRKHSTFRAGVISGALQGGSAPFTLVPRTMVKGSVWTAQELRYLNFTAKEILAVSPEERLAIQRAHALYHAEQYQYYYNMREAAKQTGAIKGRRAKIYQRLLPNWAKSRMIKHGKRFLEIRKPFLEELGVDPRLPVTFEELEQGTEGALRKVEKETAEFWGKYTASRLPEIPKVRYRQPKMKPYDVPPAGMELTNLTAKQSEALTRLGFDEKAIQRVRELALKEAELDEIIKRLDDDPKLLKAFETVVMDVKYPRLFKSLKAAAVGATAITIIYTIHEFDKSEDKTNFVINNAVTWGAFFAGVKATEMTVGKAVGHPIGRPVVDLVGGAVFAFGGATAWSHWGKPALEKNFPNRREIWESTPGLITGDLLSQIGTAGLSQPYQAGKYGLDRLELIGGVDEETDPIEYMQASARFIHPKTYWEILNGDFKWVMQDHDLNDLDDLRREAKIALNKKIDERSRVDVKKDPIKAKELDDAIDHLRSLADDSWIRRKKLELILVKSTTLEPTNEKFKDLAKANFGEDGEKAYDILMEKIQAGEQHVEEGGEMQLWKFLADQSVTFEEEGEETEVSFVDFITLSLAVHRDFLFLEELEEHYKLNEEPSEGSDNV